MSNAEILDDIYHKRVAKGWRFYARKAGGVFLLLLAIIAVFFTIVAFIVFWPSMAKVPGLFSGIYTTDEDISIIVETVMFIICLVVCLLLFYFGIKLLRVKKQAPVLEG